MDRCLRVGAHVDEGVCAWKQHKKKWRTSSVGAVAVVFVSRGNASP